MGLAEAAHAGGGRGETLRAGGQERPCSDEASLAMLVVVAGLSVLLQRKGEQTSTERSVTAASKADKRKMDEGQSDEAQPGECKSEPEAACAPR